MGRWKGKGRRKIEESVNIFFKKSECPKKKNYRKIGNKKEIYIYIYINFKTDKDEYVKLIIFFFLLKKE